MVLSKVDVSLISLEFSGEEIEIINVDVGVICEEEFAFIGDVLFTYRQLNNSFINKTCEWFLWLSDEVGSI